MKPFNIYLCGVGGQGIGLISEVMLRAADKAGLNAIGVDTHGLAQRGGTVASQIRMGAEVYSPMVSPGSADLVVSLEKNEALRGALEYLKPEGTLVYFAARWQPLSVRLGQAKEITDKDIEEFSSANSIRLFAISEKSLPDPRMQNVALLAGICRNKLVPGVGKEHYEAAMADLMTGKMLESNQLLFRNLLK